MVVDSWQHILAKSLRTTEELRDCGLICGDYPKDLQIILTPVVERLLRKEKMNGPISRQFLPNSAEFRIDSQECWDTVGEEASRLTSHLIQAYSGRVVLLVSDNCACSCRYCFRKRFFCGGVKSDFNLSDLNDSFALLRERPDINEVIISGGDPLVLEDSDLEGIFRKLAEIPSKPLLRLHTRVPVVLPSRVNKKLCDILRNSGLRFINVQVNHSTELTPECRQAFSMLCDSGFSLGSQSVLLRGVNDDVQTLVELFTNLLRCGVRPYYLFHCEPVVGSSHLRLSIAEGIEIVAKFRPLLSGMARPRYVFDLPGLRKVDLLSRDCVPDGDGGFIIRTADGDFRKLT